MSSRTRTCGIFLLAIAFAPLSAHAQRVRDLVGRWDLTVGEPPDTYPSWLGITKVDGEYRAQFVWEGGGVIEPTSLKIEGNDISFEAYRVKWTGKAEGRTMSGTCVDKDGVVKKWVGQRFFARPQVAGVWIVLDSNEAPPPKIVLNREGRAVSGEWQSADKKVPLSDVQSRWGLLSFSMGEPDVTYQARIKGDILEVASEGGGAKSGTPEKFTAQRERKWGEPIELFNGKDLEGWKPRGEKSLWKVIDGVMSNTGHGANIMSEQKFTDFKLHVEFRIPEHSNSGVYLRGRYEIQVEDTFDKPLSKGVCGAVYGRLQPKVNAARKAGEWQTYDVILVGQYLTVRHNDQLTIDNQELEGITGGAIDSDEGSPGPIYLQGDHGPVDYRKITVTPAEGG